MRILALATLLALTGAAAAQDQDPIPDLINKLGAEDFEVREQAQKDLIKIGAPAAEALKAALQHDDAEIRLRAKEALEQIRRTEVVENVISAGVKVTLDLKDVTFREAAEALGKVAGYEVVVPEPVADRKVTVQVTGTELLRVLDMLSRQVQDALWRFRGTATIVFEEGRFIDYPAAYVGPFAFKITRVTTTSDNQFTGRSTDVELLVTTQSEPTVKTLPEGMTVLAAVDQDGKKVETVRPAPTGSGGMSMSTMTLNGRTIRIVEENGQLRVIREGGGAAGAEGTTLSLDGIPTVISKLKQLICKAVFSIASEKYEKVSFAQPVRGDTKTVGNVELVIESASDRYLEIGIRSSDGKKLDPGLIREDSLVIRAGGTDHPTEFLDETDDPSQWGFGDAREMMRRVQRMVERAQGGGSPSVLIRIPKKARGQTIEALKFTVKSVVEHAVEFEFKDLDLR